MTRRLLLCLLVIVFAACPLTAQERGQICLRAFHDRNANGLLDADEALILQGIGASALDERGVTVSTQLLEDSPLAADGLLCLGPLAAGAYQVLITSSEYTPVTASEFSATVAPGTAPPLLDFAARPIAPQTTATTAGAFASDPAALEALLVAALGSGLVFLLLSLLGALLGLAIIRRRRLAPRYGPPPASAPPATSAFQDAFAPAGGSPPRFADEDTDRAALR